MAMATSPSRLDPPRVAILPTSVLGNNNSVLIAKVHMRVAKRNMPFAGRGKPKCQAAKRQYPGNHSQAPSWQPQPAEAGERQPDDSQQNKLRGDATQLRGHADPRPQRQDERDAAERREQ